MQIKGTEEQLKVMAANAVNAATPMGLGFLQATSKTFTPDDFTLHDGNLDLDYVEGRMTKLYVRRVDDGVWELRGREPRADYQSWAHKYPTYADLAASAGMAVVETSPA